MIKRVIIMCMVILFVGAIALTSADAGRGGHDRGHGRGHDSHGNGHGRGHDKGGDNGTPDMPDVQDTPSVSLPDPVELDGIGNLAKACNTDWERATYRECWGLPYKLYLQDHPFLMNQWTTRTGFPGINMHPDRRLGPMRLR